MSLTTEQLWLKKFCEVSGLQVVGTDKPFSDCAAENLLRYKNLIKSSKLNYLDLKKSLPAVPTSLVQRHIEFTEGQQYALKELGIWLTTAEPYFVLKGYAGTGKTTVVGEFAKSLNVSTTLGTAPTNKATKILRSMLKHQCKTIYSALSLKMTAREDEMILTASEHKFNLRGYKVIFVDEASMLNSDLMGYIDEVSARLRIKFLFICDEAQLPPVGEDLSPVFALKCRQAELTKVVRHDNQILMLATHIRQAIMSKKRLTPIDLNTFEGPRSVWQLSHSGFYTRLSKVASSGFTDTRAIAWRNRTVDSLNDVVRQELYSSSRKTWEIGDHIVVTEPINAGKIVLATVDDEGIIKSVDIGIDPATELDCYFLSVLMEDGQTLKMRVIHEDSDRLFSKLLAEKASEARKPGQGAKWKDFWWLNTRFNKIRHSYAITSHRSQGSTFIRTFVEAGDILANPDRDTAYRCLYVGVSRASSKLYITGLPT